MLTILYVSDLSRATRLYDVFGWPKTVDEPVYVEYQVEAGARLGLMPQAHTRAFLGEDLGARQPSDGAPRGEVYLTLPDARAAAAAFTAAGALAVSAFELRGWGDVAAYFLDRDGYVVAIAEAKAE